MREVRLRSDYLKTKTQKKTTERLLEVANKAAAAEEISLDASVAAVLSELDDIFTLKDGTEGFSCLTHDAPDRLWQGFSKTSRLNVRDKRFVQSPSKFCLLLFKHFLLAPFQVDARR